MVRILFLLPFLIGGLIIVVFLVFVSRALWYRGGPRERKYVQSSSNIMVRCPKCNALNSETATFCSKCGERLIK